MVWDTEESKWKKNNLFHKRKVTSPAKNTIQYIWLPPLDNRRRYFSHITENDNMALNQLKEPMFHGVASFILESHLLIISFTPPTGPWRNPQPSGWMHTMKHDADARLDVHVIASLREAGECVRTSHSPVSAIGIPECARSVNSKDTW